MTTDYTPEFVPGTTITVTTSASVTAGQQAVVSGDDTVAASSGASAAWIGAFAFDAASGAQVTLFARGPVHISTASGSITAGDRINTAAAGKVASASAGTTNIGIALTTVSDGESVKWMQI